HRSLAWRRRIAARIGGATGSDHSRSRPARSRRRGSHQRIREWSGIPIIIVSARGKEQDKVQALDAGADDYLTKPFGVGELLARVRVALRHAATANPETGQTVFEVPGLRVDLARRDVKVNGQAVHLTPNEFKLLSVM